MGDKLSAMSDRFCEVLAGPMTEGVALAVLRLLLDEPPTLESSVDAIARYLLDLRIVLGSDFMRLLRGV